MSRNTGGTIAATLFFAIPAAIIWLIIAAFIASTSFAFVDAVWLGVPVLFVGSAIVAGVRRGRKANRAPRRHAG